MATKTILNQISSSMSQAINSSNSSGDMFPLRCQYSLGQVCLPMNKPETYSSSPCNKPLKLINSPSPKISPSISTTTTIKSLEKKQYSLSELWREVQGCNNWEDLVEPLHPLLRQEIIRYGEFVAASYKAFNLDQGSKRYLSCKYGKGNMFQEVGLDGCGYEVTKYIYATPDVNLTIPIQGGPTANCGRWVGYVAVATDEEAIRRLGRRDILIAFRGTATNPEWIANLMSNLTPARLDPSNPREEVKVESGFLSLYTSDEIGDRKFGLVSCREQLLSEVSRLLKKYKGEEVSISLAGHSMGSSLAVLLAYDISELGLNKAGTGPARRDVPVTVYSFGGPRVGNLGFKERCEELGVKVLRIVNVNDPITKLPGVFLNEGSVKSELSWNNWSFSCYAHVGVELVLDFFNVQNPSCVHDLDAYISLLRFPNKAVEKLQNGEQIDLLLERFKGFLLNKVGGGGGGGGANNFASNMVNLVQSQRVEYLLNGHMLGLMNLLALYMIL